MSGARSRWGEQAKDSKALQRGKDEKKRIKAEKEKARETERVAKAAKAAPSQHEAQTDGRPLKRRRLSNESATNRQGALESVGSHQDDNGAGEDAPLLQLPSSSWAASRGVDNFEQLNSIEEGSYGYVSRARDITSGEIVALKKLKLGNEAVEGFPVTALREIQALRLARHRHVVNLKEVIIGKTATDVYLVMDFVEHDLRNLMEEIPEPFLLSEVKTLMIQLTAGVQFLHNNWILHRDLKTTNILLNNKGEIKIADFGMARRFSYPPPHNLTQLVVTLWYRAPELLLGTDVYGAAIDIWSIGCIFGELVRKQPLLQGSNEVDQLSKIFSLVGTPNEQSWPGFRKLPNARALRLPVTKPVASGSTAFGNKFPLLTTAGVDLLESLLSLNPDDRPGPDDILAHPFFSERPKPKPTALFPTFPSRANGERRRKVRTPNAPVRGAASEFDAAGFEMHWPKGELDGDVA